ncbi:MAG: amidohydrolase [Ignavibacteriales bacterium]|nr:amidohydrolase [Ignavibacteriales bacterium]
MKTDRRTRLFFNGTIYTGCKTTQFCEAVVTCDEHIVYAGNLQEAKRYISPQTIHIDLDGAFMLPGFIDSHMHLVWGGEYLQSVNLTTASNREDFISRLKSFIPHKISKWIVGGNWNQFNFDKVQLPDKSWIDDITGSIPTLLHRMDYHIALANSAALAIAGIKNGTPIPEGGDILFDSSGDPTGILKDAAIDIVTAHIPKPGTQQLKQFIKSTFSEANKHGITSVHDISAPEHIPVLKDMERKGHLTCRVYSRLPIEQHQDFIDIGITRNFGKDYLKLGSLKAFADGSLGAGTAWMFDHFNDEPHNAGMAMEIMSSGKLAEYVAHADAHHLQVSVHAIGDKANHEVLNILERTSKQNKFWDRRFRIEHAQHLHPDDVERFGKLGAIASMQPLHLHEDGGWMHSRIGVDRCKGAYMFGSLIGSGARVCFGSDFPIVSLDPIAGIYSAVTRKVKNSRPQVENIARELITLQDAIDCYTKNAAYAAFEENCKGTIEPGKLADFAVLDRNLFLIDYDELPEVKVLKTFVGAKEVYHS